MQGNSDSSPGPDAPTNEAPDSRMPLIRRSEHTFRVKSSRCKYCGALIWWAKTESGKATPMDPEALSDADWVIGDYDDETRAPVIRQYEPLLDRPRPGKSSRPRYQPHWASCPHADEHRKAKK